MSADPSNADTILSKVRGVSHGGGVQLTSDSQEFQDLATFVSLVVDCGAACTTVDTDGFFDGIELADARKTLRKASILLAGRLPSEEEYLAAELNEDTLRDSIIDLMVGEEFHDFLIRGANDRLLTDGHFNGTDLTNANPDSVLYPILANRRYEAVAAGAAEEEEYNLWWVKLHYGMARSPLELIAYVIQEERPYSEILTADYMMQNPQLGYVFQSNLPFSTDSRNEFLPGAHNGQILKDDQLDAIYTQFEGNFVVSHGPTVDYPTSGVLNTPSFLARYPTTDTNRNRARSRWTYYHFLGFDIEKSASRTTDPEALADTNNPTLNNPNCTVCHQIMDPVAGTYQNYGITNYYRENNGGMDSLPLAYKDNADAEDPYQEGDTWFRDMRSPGFNGALADDNGNSIQWLANQIITDERFFEAGVKFWWSSIVSDEILEAPEDTRDQFFVERLRAFERQSADIRSISESFSEHKNAKQMMADIIMSPWFRATKSLEVIDEARQIELSNLGVNALLTPESLERKTQYLTGNVWGYYENDWLAKGRFSNLGDRFRVYYGGIDSVGITERAREINALMSNVTQAHALELSCSTTIKEFTGQQDDREIFNAVSIFDTPTRDQILEFEVESVNEGTPDVLELDVSFSSTDSRLITVALENDSNVGGLNNIYVKTLTIFDNENNELINLPWEEATAVEGGVQSEGGGGFFGAWQLHGFGSYVSAAFTPPAAGAYRIVIDTYGERDSDTLPKASLSVSYSDGRLGDHGQEVVKEQLSRLHEVFWGEDSTTDSTEIDHSFDLFVDLWNTRNSFDYSTINVNTESQEACLIDDDDWPGHLVEIEDPYHLIATWGDMLLYFMTDFKYLHE